MLAIVIKREKHLSAIYGDWMPDSGFVAICRSVDRDARQVALEFRASDHRSKDNAGTVAFYDALSP